MWEITAASPEAAAFDAVKALPVEASAAASQAVAVATVPVTAMQVGSTVASPPSVPVITSPPAETLVTAEEVSSVAAGAAPANGDGMLSVDVTGSPGDGLADIVAILERLRNVPLRTRVQPGMTAADQLAALQASTALHLLHAGANMLLMHSGILGPVTVEMAAPSGAVAKKPEVEAPSPTQSLVSEVNPGLIAKTAAPKAEEEPPTPAVVRSPKMELPSVVERPFASAAIALPTCLTLPSEPSAAAIRKVTLGGSGTRTSAVTIGGSQVLPLRHFEGDTGHSPVIAMEVFDTAPKAYPDSLRASYGELLNDPKAMARFCVDKLGAQVISIRLRGTHPENGDASPEAAADLVGEIAKAVGVPLIITGPNHYEKNNAVMKHIAAVFAGENLLLNWVESDNYKTIAAAAMGYGHCVVAQTPIDVNMCKQLNILLTNMGFPPEKILIDPMTGALGYGLEYTYSVMERIRSSAFMGDSMLALPMISNPGYEVARTKESRASQKDFPLWGRAEERGALLEIATAMSLMNSGADLLVMYHPLAAQTMKRKIAEMNFRAS